MSKSPGTVDFEKSVYQTLASLAEKATEQRKAYWQQIGEACCAAQDSAAVHQEMLACTMARLRDENAANASKMAVREELAIDCDMRSSRQNTAELQEFLQSEVGNLIGGIRDRVEAAVRSSIAFNLARVLLVS